MTEKKRKPTADVTPESAETKPGTSEEALALSDYAGALGFEVGERSPARGAIRDPRMIALQPGIQALWNALLPVVGVRASRPDEFPGIFKVEAGPGEDEATVYLDVADEPYEPGKNAPMDRVIALRVKLDHDYRMLGDQYFCIDCEVPDSETRH